MEFVGFIVFFILEDTVSHSVQRPKCDACHQNNGKHDIYGHCNGEVCSSGCLLPLEKLLDRVDDHDESEEIQKHQDADPFHQCIAHSNDVDQPVEKEQ